MRSDGEQDMTIWSTLMHRTLVALACAITLASGSALAQQEPTLTDKAKATAQNVGEKTKQVVEKVKDKVGSAVNKAGDKTAEFGHKVGDKASDIGHKVGDKAEDAKTSVMGADKDRK
jgi:hypothetical protein